MIPLHYLKKWRVAAALSAVVAAFALIFLCFANLSPGNGSKPLLFELKSGCSLRKTAADLKSRGLISSAGLFVLYARLTGEGGKLQAGTYRLDNGMSPRAILHKMATGDVYRLLFAVPEGYSIYQVAELLEQKGLLGKNNFLSACFDRPFLTQIGIHGGSAEGYLFPGTYNLVGKTNGREVVAEMVEQFRRMQAPRFDERVKDSGMSWREVLTMASMIEKEAVTPAERPLIASVFHNRIKKGMRLQSDPTAIYGIRAFAGKVTKEDILRRTPYNTYCIDGLPPGPIGNPSPEAIQAALNPARTPYLYFVAKNDGSHQFSVTLEDHNAAVRRFLR